MIESALFKTKDLCIEASVTVQSLGLWVSTWRLRVRQETLTISRFARVTLQVCVRFHLWSRTRATTQAFHQFYPGAEHSETAESASACNFKSQPQPPAPAAHVHHLSLLRVCLWSGARSRRLQCIVTVHRKGLLGSTARGKLQERPKLTCES